MELQPATILCVDDEPEVLDLLKEYFGLQGFVVLTATNGVEAFLQAKQWMPRAVVMDLFMPRLGGIGALARIKALNPGIAVILVSGMGNALDLVTEAGLSVDAAIAKPLDLAKLSDALARVGVMAPAALAAGHGSHRPRPIRARVLVVDDELELRKMLSEHLQEKGYDVLEAADGEEAMARMPEYRPHIVLLDLMMAGIGGMETLRRVKAMAPETCVIMVTAIEEIESARTALGRGASDYITKPFSLKYLDSVLEVHLLMDRIDPDSK
ncbi:MAG: response regulator [Candidatus Rokubacteria bacterium]|nr:response regulator [Candidatus Rokubacteria bacterium]